MSSHTGQELRLTLRSHATCENTQSFVSLFEFRSQHLLAAVKSGAELGVYGKVLHFSLCLTISSILDFRTEAVATLPSPGHPSST